MLVVSEILGNGNSDIYCAIVLPFKVFIIIVKETGLLITRTETNKI